MRAERLYVGREPDAWWGEGQERRSVLNLGLDMEKKHQGMVESGGITCCEKGEASGVGEHGHNLNIVLSSFSSAYKTWVKRLAVCLGGCHCVFGSSECSAHVYCCWRQLGS